MARSGSYDFTQTRDETIDRALRLIGVLGESQSASATRIAQASMALNSMTKLWGQMGIGLWLNKEIVLFMQKDQVKYYLGPNMVSTYGDYACLFTDYAKTEMASAAAAAATAMTVDSITPSNPEDFAASDYVGVETDNLDIHWTTINGAPAGTTITLTTGLDYAASANRHVYGFTTVIQRPLEVISGFRRDKDENDVVMDFISLDEYRALSTKTSEGKPNVFAVDMQLDDIIVYIWPEPNDMKDRIHLFVRYPLQDFDAASDNWDFNEGWGEAITFNLAVRLAPEYGRVASPEVKEIAMLSLNAMTGSDTENTSMRFRPARRYYR